MHTRQNGTRTHHIPALSKRFFIGLADMKGEAITQRGREAFIFFAFIKREQREARIDMRLHALPFHMKSARVERGAKMGNCIGRQSLGHSRNNHAAMAFGQETAHGNGLSGGKRRAQIKPADAASRARAWSRPSTWP